MSLAARYASAGWGLVKRDAVMFASYRTQTISQILGVFFSLALFYYIAKLVTVESFGSPAAYFAFVVVGMVILQVVQSTLELSSTVRGELLTGTFERLVVSPYGAVGGILAMVVFPFALALVLALATLGFGALLFGMDIEWSTAPLAIPVAILGATSFAAVGLLFVASVIVIKQTASGAGFFTAVVAIVGGLYFPVALLPGWIQWASEVQPFTPAVNLLRHLLLGTDRTGSLVIELLQLGGFGVVLLPLAILAIRRAIRHARQRGTIIEY